MISGNPTFFRNGGSSSILTLSDSFQYSKVKILIKCMSYFFTGATLPLRLCWRSKIWLFSDPRLAPAQAIQRILRNEPRRRSSKSGCASRHGVRVPQQELRGHLRVLRVSPQLLLPAVLFSFPGYRFLLWIQRVRIKIKNYVFLIFLFYLLLNRSVETLSEDL